MSFSFGTPPRQGRASDASEREQDDSSQNCYFPEDERAPLDEESDHSGVDDIPDIPDSVPGAAHEAEPDAENATRAELPPLATLCPENGNAYFPEDERTPMDEESDHSGVDDIPDIPDSIPDAASVAQGAAHDTEPDAENAAGETSIPMEGHAKSNHELGTDSLHPGLAAALHASLHYSTHGLTLDKKQPPVSNDNTAVAIDNPSLSSDSAVALPSDDTLTPVESEMPPKNVPPRSSTDSAPDTSKNGEGAAVVTQETPLQGKGVLENTREDEAEVKRTNDDESEEGPPMTLRDHLVELRKRIFRAFIYSFAGFCICYPFADKISKILLQPLLTIMPKGTSFIFTRPPEAFFMEMKVSFVAGIFLASPLVFYQIWAFVAPGLYKEEKVYILPIAFFSALFFLCGGMFCYFVVFPYAFQFFMSYNSDFLKAMLSISDTTSFVLQLLMAFGLIFELPLFIFFLARLGIISADLLRRMRRYAILVMFIVAALLTPPDVVSQLLMTMPLLLLYELSIFIAVAVGKKKNQASDNE